jgi:uncharacterized membrane protein
MRSPSLTSPWPAGRAIAGVPWAFGRELPADAVGGPVLQWLFKRNCSITPSQLMAVYASLCGVSLLISALFMWHGAPLVMLFAGLELTVVGVALLAFARHAGDRETLTLAGRSLSVEQRIGNRVERTDFVAEWLSVEPAAGQGSLVQLSGEGRTVRVGRFLRPELRPALAHELRRALRRLPHAPAPHTDSP